MVRATNFSETMTWSFVLSPSGRGQSLYFAIFPRTTSSRARSVPDMLLLSVLLLSSLCFAAFTTPPQSFTNTAIARTIELGGATTQVTTQYTVKSSVDGPGEYHLALAGERDEEPAWWEVTIGGKAVEGLEVVFSR